jgi:hypothetical protein
MFSFSAISREVKPAFRRASLVAAQKRIVNNFPDVGDTALGKPA